MNNNKVITSYAGNKVRIRCGKNDSLWDFKAGDIITMDKKFKNSMWYDKKVIVEGFDFMKNLLWGISIIRNEKMTLFECDAEGLILLERSGYKFKVGDKVKAYKSRYSGEIVVINPEGNQRFPYLVEFKKSDRKDDIISYAFFKDIFQNKPWMPEKYRSSENTKHCYWCIEEQLIKASC